MKINALYTDIKNLKDFSPFSKLAKKTKQERCRYLRKAVDALSGGDTQQLLDFTFEQHLSKKKKNYPPQDLVLKLIDRYNLLGKKEIDRISKQHLMGCMVNSFSRIDLRSLGMRFSNTTYSQSLQADGAIREKKPRSDREKYKLIRENVKKFLSKNSSIAANRLILVDGILKSVCYLQNTIIGTFNDYIKSCELDMHLSESLFRKIIRELKRYKRPKKRTDLCETCKIGRLNVQKVTILEKEITHLSLLLKTDIEPDAIHPINSPTEIKKMIETKRKEMIQLTFQSDLFKQHQENFTNQRNSFKYLKSKERLVEKNSILIVMDFKENLKLGFGPEEYGKSFYEKEVRTLLGFVLYYYEDNTYKKKYVNLLSNVLSHDSNFVRKAIDHLSSSYPFIEKYSEVLLFMDNGAHFKNAGLLHYLLFVKNWVPHYFGENHGKSPCDAHFSLLTRWIKNISEVVSVNSNEDLIRELEKKINQTEELKQHQIEKKKDKTEKKPLRKRPSIAKCKKEKEIKVETQTSVSFLQIDKKDYVVDLEFSCLKIKDMLTFFSFRKYGKDITATISSMKSYKKVEFEITTQIARKTAPKISLEVKNLTPQQYSIGITRKLTKQLLANTEDCNVIDLLTENLSTSCKLNEKRRLEEKGDLEKEKKKPRFQKENEKENEKQTEKEKENEKQTEKEKKKEKKKSKVNLETEFKIETKQKFYWKNQIIATQFCYRMPRRKKDPKSVL